MQDPLLGPPGFIGTLRGVGVRDYTSVFRPYEVLTIGMKAPYPPLPPTPLRVLMMDVLYADTRTYTLGVQGPKSWVVWQKPLGVIIVVSGIMKLTNWVLLVTWTCCGICFRSMQVILLCSE